MAASEDPATLAVVLARPEISPLLAAKAAELSVSSPWTVVSLTVPNPLKLTISSNLKTAELIVAPWTTVTFWNLKPRWLVPSIWFSVPLEPVMDTAVVDTTSTASSALSVVRKVAIT